MASLNSNAPQSTEATKNRIIQHMNADHVDSLVRYLEYFHKLSSHTARNARLADITLYSLLVTTAPTNKPASIDNTYTIVLSPPMNSFSEARERVVEIDKQCRAALGQSDIIVKRYVPPRKPFHFLVLFACIFTFVLLHRRSYLDPATAPGFIKRTFIDRFPRAFAFFHRVQPPVFYPMVALHLWEAWWMDRSRLRKHSVPRGSAVWWAWVVSTFTEGFGNFQRLDAYVAEERRKKEKKH